MKTYANRIELKKYVHVIIFVHIPMILLHAQSVFNFPTTAFERTGLNILLGPGLMNKGFHYNQCNVFLSLVC